MNRHLLFLALVFATGCATSPAVRDIDRFVEQTLQQIPEAPSIGIAVVHEGHPRYARAFGLRDVERGIAPDAQTGYYIGSTTKAYTGLACAILAGRGQLDLDAPISKYLPEVNMTTTLRSFLTHTSGVENFGIVFRTAFTGDHTPAQLVSLLNLSRPGKGGFRYDNLGYVVASLAIERVTGKPWQQVLDELVFTPLGMNHTTAYMSEAERWPMATPYQINRKGEIVVLDFRKNDQMMHAAGGIVTTPADLARWLEANMTNGRIDGRQVIPAAAFEETHRQQVATPPRSGNFTRDGYGFGWYQGKYDGDVVLSHGGGFEGWQSFYSFMPGKKIGVGVMSNTSGGRVLDLISTYVYDRLLNKPDVDAKYAARLAKLKTDIRKEKEQFIAEIDKRSKRPWSLQHPNQAYVGRYENPLFGTVIIEQRGDRLHASLARLSSVLEAFTEPESARVELVPGSGEVLRFTFTNADTPDSMKWGEDVFVRQR